MHTRLSKKDKEKKGVGDIKRDSIPTMGLTVRGVMGRQAKEISPAFSPQTTENLL